MHGSCSKEWPYAAQREDGTRMRDSVSTACNNFSVIVERSESADAAVYGAAFMHARNNKPRRGTPAILFWFKATVASSTLKQRS
ncbi:hypothetical protein X777_14629 [Ooceraea biroi]|uniref:Uncharacterized protein n=1 Tax=Ooceraea biroi TaxID=2015173 RepID=A0A026WXT3_OOCBI|nr:hypothetical protein X777_14629 [Ooceraea biroi]